MAKPRTSPITHVRGHKLAKNAFRLRGTQPEMKTAAGWQSLPGVVCDRGLLHYSFRRADGRAISSRLDLLLLAVARAVTK